MSEKKEDKKAKPAREPKDGQKGEQKGEKKARSAAKQAGAKPAAVRSNAKPAGPARLGAFYRDTVVKGLTEKFGYKSVMQVPRIDKIVLNMGVGEAVADKKIMDNAVADMTKNRRAETAGDQVAQGYCFVQDS